MDLKELWAAITLFFDGGIKKLLGSSLAFLASALTSHEAQAVAAALGFVSLIMAIRYYMVRQKLVNKILEQPMHASVSLADIQHLIDEKFEHIKHHSHKKNESH